MRDILVCTISSVTFISPMKMVVLVLLILFFLVYLSFTFVLLSLPLGDIHWSVIRHCDF